MLCAMHPPRGAAPGPGFAAGAAAAACDSAASTAQPGGRPTSPAILVDCLRRLRNPLQEADGGQPRRDCCAHHPCRHRAGPDHGACALAAAAAAGAGAAACGCWGGPSVGCLQRLQVPLPVNLSCLSVQVCCCCRHLQTDLDPRMLPWAVACALPLSRMAQVPPALLTLLSSTAGLSQRGRLNPSLHSVALS